MGDHTADLRAALLGADPATRAAIRDMVIDEDDRGDGDGSGAAEGGKRPRRANRRYVQE
jgi:hypothetical protein